MSAEITMPTIDQGTDVDVWQRLAEPFKPDQVGKKPIGKGNGNRGTCRVCGGYHAGGMSHLDFVGHATVTHRLNMVVGPGNWHYTIDRIVESDGHVQAVIGTMTILGRTIGPEVGEPERESTYGVELKVAISDYIRRAAMRFGLALDLWARGELESVTRATPEATTAVLPDAGSPPLASSQPARKEPVASSAAGRGESFEAVCAGLGISGPTALKTLRHGKTSGALPEEFPLLASLADAHNLKGDQLAIAARYLETQRHAA